MIKLDLDDSSTTGDCGYSQPGVATGTTIAIAQALQFVAPIDLGRQNQHDEPPRPSSAQQTAPGAAQPLEQFEPDIGKLIQQGHANLIQQGHANLGHLSRDEVYRVLKLDPDVNPSSYPRTRSHPSKALFCQCQPAWVKKYPWIHYSPMDGAFCRACELFAPSQVSGQKLRKFVSTPLTSWIKMSEKATQHGKNDYHQFAITKMSEFITRYEDPSVDISNLFNSESRRIIEGNQKVIESLFRVGIVCGKQGLALRGHRDDKVDWAEEQGHNEGNFIELVKFPIMYWLIIWRSLPRMPNIRQKRSKMS